MKKRKTQRIALASAGFVGALAIAIAAGVGRPAEPVVTPGVQQEQTTSVAQEVVDPQSAVAEAPAPAPVAQAVAEPQEQEQPQAAPAAPQETESYEVFEGTPSEPFVIPEDVAYEPQTALVSVGGNVTAEELNGALEAMGDVAAAPVTEEDLEGGLVRIELSEGTSVEDAVNELRAQGVVEDAQPNYTYEAMETDDDLTGDLTDAGETPFVDDPAQDDLASNLTTDENGDQADQATSPEDANSADGAASLEAAEADAASDAEEQDELEENEGIAPLLEALGLEVNDARVGEQWGLESIYAFDAWSTVQANHQVTVAVLDLGFQTNHPDLADNIVATYNSYNAVHGGSTTDVTPYYGNANHGTHVAGIIAGVSNNKVGISGASYNANILPIKVVSSSGTAGTDELVEAYDYVISHKDQYNIRVINLSMGAKGAIEDDAFIRAIEEAYAAGIVTVSSAGNADASAGWIPPFECYPGDYRHVVSVINLDKSGSGVVVEEDSNYNSSSEHDKNISAPGARILSTKTGSSYGTMTGTSMAAPFVSATLALEFAAKPSLSAAEAVNTLYATTTDLGASGWDASTGWGEVNARDAVRGVVNGVDASRMNAVVSLLSGGKWRRLYGNSRYDTMASIVETGFSSSSWAVVASGESFPDALSASALAGIMDCPVILTAKNSLSPQARSQLKARNVQNVYVIGGESAVSSAVVDELQKMPVSVMRVAGSDRLDTSLSCFRVARTLTSSPNTVVISTGWNFADALSIGPWAYCKEVPVMLVKADGTLTAQQAAAINADANITRVVIVGGTSVVSDQVRAQLPGKSFTRLAGADRYATSKAVAEFSVREGLRWANCAVATGANYPDALAGTALCGKNNSVLLLANKASDPTVQLIKANDYSISKGYILGGPAAVSESLASVLYEMGD